jgi:hypothetical protein
MSAFVFVGERPSATAAKKGIRWEHGCLAAKQLFDALRAAGIDPAGCTFVNLFGMQPDRDAAPCFVGKIARQLQARSSSGDRVVAMGAKVSAELQRRGVEHVQIIHPAARGAIRRKDRYAAHVLAALGGT